MAYYQPDLEEQERSQRANKGLRYAQYFAAFLVIGVMAVFFYKAILGTGGSYYTGVSGMIDNAIPEKPKKAKARRLAR